MATDPIFFRDLAYVFVAAVLGAAMAWLARQPLILGYVVGGLLISPLTPGPAVSQLHTFELFAEVGVVLLMFSIGIEFSLQDLLRVRWVATLGGPLGIVLSAALGAGVGVVLGWPPLQGLIVGLVVSVASTMILARLLMDRGELHSRHGRIMIGITLVEDLAVVVLIVLIPRLGLQDGSRLLDIAAGIGLALAILVPFLYLAGKVVPPLLWSVARTHSQELFLMVALAIALGTAAVTQAVGLSLALGAFLAGLVISQSDFAHETLARLLPLRDAFVALFFVTMGALINPAGVVDDVPLLLVIVVLVVVGKFVIWTAVVWLFRQGLRTAVIVAVGLTQIGEFSFILVQVARSAGHVGDEVYQAVLAASLLTVLVNALLVRHVPRWLAGRAAARPVAPPTIDPARLEGHVVICGFGRVGSAVADALETFGMPYVAIEIDAEIVENLRARGVACLYGNAADRRTLRQAGVERAVLAVVAIPEIEPAHVAVHEIHGLNPRIAVLGRAHDAEGRDRLVEAGATEVIQPEVEAASTLIRHALRRLALPRDETLAYVARYREAMDAAAPDPAPATEAMPEIRELPVGPALADCSLREAKIRERFGATVLAVRRADGDVVPHPSPDAVLRAGDRIRVFGLRQRVDDLAAQMEREER